MTEEEKDFMIFWEANREKEKNTWRQLLIGLPLGMIFTLPILVNLFSGWNKRATMVANAQINPVILIIAVLAIASFFAIFNKKHRWDMNEQRYNELKTKKEK
ncbi:MAG: hypothetical protein IT249_06975 [Chitinophagaceae bacterium]|nr:hypothetical protein [Chitinophagaceae bacterium]